MSKNLNKILAGVLAAAVIAGAAPMTAMAAGATGAAAPKAAVDTDSDLILPPDDGFDYTTGGVEPIRPEDLDKDHIISSESDYYKKLYGSDNDAPCTAPAALPSKVDNSTNQNAKYLPLVRSQGGIGSCCAWSSVYYQFTYTKNKARGVATTDANTYSPNFVYNFNNGGALMQGSSLINNYKILTYQGAPTIKDAPILTSTSPATNVRSWYATGDMWEKATHNRMVDYDVFCAGSISSLKDTGVYPVSYYRIISEPTDSELDAMKAALNNGEILSFCTMIGAWHGKAIKSVNANDRNANPNGYVVDNSYVGKKSVYAQGTTDSAHEMTIVGYNDEIWTDINDNGVVDKGEMGAFRILNSWGNWEDKGYIWLAYDSLNVTSAVTNAPAIEKRTKSMWSVARMNVTNSQDDSSGIYLKYVLNSAYRSDNTLKIKAVKNGTTVKEMNVTPYNVRATPDNSEFKLNYLGTEAYGDGTMYFDLNNIVSNINSANLKDYTWTVTVSDTNADGKSLTVKEMKIVDKKANKEYAMDRTAGFALDGTNATVNVPITDPVPVNAVTIYYKGYSTPYIHYRAGTGAWTAVPGVRMTATNEVSGYTHKYTINLGSASYAEVCFNNGSGSWDSRNGANYRFNKGTYTFSNGTITTYTPPVPQALSLNVTSSDSTVPASGSFTVNASAQGGTAPYQYRYSYISSSGLETQVKDYSSYTSASYSIPQNGYYTIKVIVKDATGKTVEKTTNVTVASVTLYGISSDKASPKVGDKIKFSGSVYTNGIKLTYKYTVTGNGTTQTLTTNSDNTAYWTPSKEGVYNAKLELYFGNKPVVSSSMTVNVQPGDPVPVNAVTIYYKGYSTPYIHYRAGTGAWTAVPGVRMTATNEVSGYTHKYTINLGSASYAEVCFNNGSGSWDSKNGANYRFNKGTYTFSNGTINTYTAPQPKELSLNASLSDTVVLSGKSFTINATATGGTAPYQYRYTAVYRGSETVLKDYSTSATCTASLGQYAAYTIKVTVKDATGKTVEKTANLTVTYISYINLFADKTTSKTGEKVTFTAQAATNGISVTYKYTVTGNGTTQTLTTNSNNTATWTPSKEGSYTAKVEVLYKGESIISKTISITVEKGTNIVTNAVTIYYKGYSTPYIHYQVGTGAWTAVPGVRMTATGEMSGYTHKYTINLGSASYANVCFNNGSGSWDSRNGQNYRFSKGTYKYANGNSVYVSANPTTAATATAGTLTNVSAVSTSKIALGSSVTVNAAAFGGSGDYSYAVYYKKAASNTWTTVKSYGKTATASVKPAAVGSYDVCVKVKDTNGTVAKQYFTVKVVSKLSNASTVSAVSVKKGQTVTVNCKAAGGISGYTYTVSYKKTASNTWTVKQSDSENASVSIKPAVSTSYDICVKVKDMAGNVAEKFFTVTVK